LVCDDFPLSTKLDQGFLAYWHSAIAGEGIFRILGYPIIVLITHSSLLPGILALCTHIVAVLCFFRICQRLFKNTLNSVILSLLMGIFPWGYTALLWASAYLYELTTALFLINLLLLIELSHQPKSQPVLGFISYGLTLIALLILEPLTFAFMFSSGIIWILGSRNQRIFISVKQRLWNVLSSWGSALGSLTYIGLYQGFKNDYMMKPTVLNLKTLLSFHYYQYSNFYVFEPWLNSTNWPLMFTEWHGFTIAIALLLSLAVIPGLILLSRNDFDRQTTKPGWKLLIYILVLLVGASLIYTIAGGFSLDSRKKYPLIPLLLLLVGWLWSYFEAMQSNLLSHKRFILATVMILGVSTTWLITGIWHYEVDRYTSLTDFLVQKNIAGAIQIEWNPNLYATWPTMGTTIGFRMDDNWVLNQAIAYKGGQPVQVAPAPNATTLRFDPHTATWAAQPALPGL